MSAARPLDFRQGSKVGHAPLWFYDGDCAQRSAKWQSAEDGFKRIVVHEADRYYVLPTSWPVTP